MHHVNYQVVPITYRQTYNKRESVKAQIYLETLNQKYELYLEESNHILFGSRTPVFIASYDKNSFGLKVLKYVRNKKKLNSIFTTLGIDTILYYIYFSLYGVEK